MNSVINMVVGRRLFCAFKRGTNVSRAMGKVLSIFGKWSKIVFFFKKSNLLESQREFSALKGLKALITEASIPPKDILVALD